MHVRSGLLAMTVSGPKACGGGIRGGEGRSAMHTPLGLLARTTSEVGKSCAASSAGVVVSGMRRTGLGNVLSVEPREVYLSLCDQPGPRARANDLPLIVQRAVGNM